MKKIFKELEAIFNREGSIMLYADEVENLRKQLKKEDDVIDFVNKVRAKVQREAVEAVIDNEGRGLVAMATGAGKSKVGIDLAKHYNLEEHDTHIGLIVPTEKLRDENWKEEFDKWEALDLWEKTERLCYASASKIKGFTINLLIGDEGHNITSLASQFFENNEVRNVVLLTATPPEGLEKMILLSNLNIPVVYHLTLDVAVKLGFVAPYKITIVTTVLDDVDKYVPAGNKNNPFFTTERGNYQYLTTVIDHVNSKVTLTMQDMKRRQFAIFNRMHSIYKLRSKTRVAEFLLKNVISPEDRTLIFCGSIDQANELSEHTYHSKIDSKGYDLFKSEKVNRLSCVKAINEGHNFPGIDSGLIVQLNSKEKDLIQRIGRLLRFRPGHEAHLYIIVVKDTQDEVWLNNALINFDKDKVEYIDYNDLKN